jgi:endonuclease/exonuclease/phosphatase family metal-dependent hydrolase
MKRLLICLVFMGAAPGQAHETLRIVTYNIHHGEGLDQRVDLDRIAAILEALDADVICLQEVDQNLPRTGLVDMPALLSEKLGMPVYFESNYDFDGGRYGNATLTRLPVREHANFPLPGPAGVEPRGCLRVTVEVGKHVVDVLNTHFGLRPDERRDQAAAVVDLLRAYPAILAGDINARPGDPPLAILGTVFDDTYLPGQDPHDAAPGQIKSRIDYVLISRGLQPLASGFVRTPATAVASDHMPYVAHVDLGRPPETLEDYGIHSNEDERLEDALLKETRDEHH